MSRESQKTREFGVRGGLLEVRVSNKTDLQDRFLEFPGVQRKIQPFRWEEHDGISLPSKIQPDQTARLGDISNPSWSIFGRRSDGLNQLLNSSIEST